MCAHRLLCHGDAMSRQPRRQAALRRPAEEERVQQADTTGRQQHGPTDGETRTQAVSTHRCRK